MDVSLDDDGRWQHAETCKHYQLRKPFLGQKTSALNDQ